MNKTTLTTIEEITYLALSARNTLGLTQEEFCKRTGIALGTQRRWEQGVSKPNEAGIILLRLIKSNPHTILDLFANIQK